MTKIPSKTWLLIILLSIINLISYFISGETSNYFQDYFSANHIATTVFTYENQIGLALMIAILAINLHPQLEGLSNQKYLLIMLCIFNIFLHVSKQFYPLIYGINNVIFTLTNAWVQIFCPATLRGLISGVLSGTNGFLDVLDTAIETDWSWDIYLAHGTGIIMLILALWLLKLLGEMKFKKQKKHYISLTTLCNHYLFIMLSSILVGLNSGIFNYTFDIAETVLPKENPEKFQYMVNIISIIAPFLFGFIADKYGYMKTQMYTLYTLTVVHFSNTVASYLSIQAALVYYSLGFLEACLSNCLCVSILAIFGQYLLHQGIFRSFALFGILSNLGILICGFIYELFSNSYAEYQFYMGIANFILIIFLLKNYKKFLLLNQNKTEKG